MGGPRLAAEGAELVVDSTPLAVVGLTEVLGRLPSLFRAKWALQASIREWRPDVLLAVDYPDFNLRLTRWARGLNVPVAYFVSPQVWAWRPGRITGIGRSISRMLVIFPFETAPYSAASIPVEHVGHPLMDEPVTGPTRDEARSALGLSPDVSVIAILPGSRVSEWKRTWSIMLATCRRLAAERDARFLVPLPPGRQAEELRSVEDPGDLPLQFVDDGTHPVLAACDVALVASGTATLETALLPRPLVVGYRVSRLTDWLGSRLIDRDFGAAGRFALPNLVLADDVVPELYQDDFSPERLASELGRLLDDPEARERQLRALRRLPEKLGGPGTFERVARACLELADEGSARSN